MVDTNKIQEAMSEVDRQFEAARPMITTTAAARPNGSEPATLISWLKRFDDRQADMDRKLTRILNFLGAIEK
jgi:hypothetical protein